MQAAGESLKRYEQFGWDFAAFNPLSDKEIARSNVSKLAANAQRRVRLVCDDMSQFTLDKEFGLVYIADNSFRELIDLRQQRKCLECVIRHLRSDGVFLMTERRFDPAWFEKSCRRASDWSEPMAHPETGNWFQRRLEAQLSDDGKWISGQFIYRTHDSDGTELIDACPVLAQVMTIVEYRDLLEASGFDVNLRVGYEDDPDDGENPTLCFICRKQK